MTKGHRLEYSIVTPCVYSYHTYICIEKTLIYNTSEYRIGSLYVCDGKVKNSSANGISKGRSGCFFLPGNPFGPYFELEPFWEIYIL